MNKIRLSVIVPTFNRLPSLKKLMVCLQRQDLDPALYEVVVVNDGSTDGTTEYLLDVNPGMPSIQVVTQVNRGVSAARNAGVMAAKGEFVVFTDDDCLPEGNWLSRLYAHSLTLGDNVVGIGGPLENRSDESVTWLTRYLDYVDEFNQVQVEGRWLPRLRHVSTLATSDKVLYLRTSNAMFRRNHIIQVGLFDLSFRRPGGEDPDLCYRLLKNGGFFLFDPELVVGHAARDSVASFLRSLKNYVAGELRSSRKRHQYPCHIARMYYVVPLRKIMSLLYSFLSFPFRFAATSGRSFTVHESLVFPVIDIGVKAYALFVTVKLLSRSE